MFKLRTLSCWNLNFVTCLSVTAGLHRFTDGRGVGEEGQVLLMCMIQDGHIHSWRGRVIAVAVHRHTDYSVFRSFVINRCHYVSV